MQSRNRNERVLWATPIVASAPLWLGHILGAPPINWRWDFRGDNARRESCQANLHTLGLALASYSQDYDDKLPPATIGGLGVGDKVRNGRPPAGWIEMLSGHNWIISDRFRFCPSQRPERSQAATSNTPTSRGFTDYWINARVTRRARSSVSDPAYTFLLGEGNDGFDASDATYSKFGFPTNWIEDAGSPMFRHQGSANYLFVDGHVECLSPAKATHIGGDAFAP